MTEYLKQQRLGPFTKDEIPIPLQIQFVDSTGEAINLAAYDKVELVIKGVDDTADITAAGTASFDDKNTGKTKYVWAGADFAVAGHYRAQMWVQDDAANQPRLASEVYEWFVRAATDKPSAF